jgi:hypothetical protein
MLAVLNSRRAIRKILHPIDATSRKHTGGLESGLPPRFQQETLSMSTIHYGEVRRRTVTASEEDEYGRVRSQLIAEFVSLVSGDTLHPTGQSADFVHVWRRDRVDDK